MPAICASVRCARARSLITAASTSPVRPYTPTKTWASRSRSSGVLPANGPWPASVSGIAIAATINVAATAPGCQKRRATAISGGRVRKVSEASLVKQMAATPPTSRPRATASSRRPGARR